MRKLSKTLPLIVLMSLGSGLTAQEAGTAAGDAVDPGLDMGREVQEATYFRGTYDDWKMRCIRNDTKDEADDLCQSYQLLYEASGNPVAEFTLYRLPEGSPATAGATVVVPLGTLLPAELKMRVDDGPAKSYAYSFCTAIGCVSRIGLTAEEVAALKAGSQATLTIVPAQAPDQSVDIPVSLKGFTAAYEDASVLAN